MAAMGKLAFEILEKLSDDVARLKAAGKVEEAAAKEIEQAKVYKQFKQEGALDAPAPESSGLPEISPMDDGSPKTLADAISVDAPAAPLDIGAGDTSGGFGKKAKVGAGAAAAGGLAYALSRKEDAGLETGAIPGSVKSDTSAESVGSGVSDVPKTGTPKPKIPVPSAPSGPARPEKSELQSLMDRLSTGDAPGQTDTSGFDSERRQAKSDLDKGRERADYASLADRIGRAAVQIGASQQGLKSNVDLSSIKGEPADTRSISDRAEKDYESSKAEISGREKDAKEATEASNKSREAREKQLADLLKDDYFSKVKEKGADSRQANQIKSNEKIAGMNVDSREAAAKIRAESASNPSGKAAAKKADTLSKGQAELDRLSKVAADEKATTKDRKKAAQQAEKLFGQLYPTEVETRNRLFQLKPGEGFLASDAVDFDGIRKYNQTKSGAASSPSSVEGTQTVTVVAPSGKTKVYQKDDPALQKVLATPGFKAL